LLDEEKILNRFFSPLTLFHHAPTCVASGDWSVPVLRSTPLCRSSPRFDRSIHPCNPHSGPRPPQPRATPFKRLYRTRAEHLAQFQFFVKTRRHPLVIFMRFW